MTRHSKPNEWQKRYGAARLANDRALIEEVEQQIALEDDIRDAVAREFSDYRRQAEKREKSR
jgi:hypothetical protein